VEGLNCDFINRTDIHRDVPNVQKTELKAFRVFSALQSECASPNSALTIPQKGVKAKKV
jgi:hypothetical protein